MKEFVRIKDYVSVALMQQRRVSLIGAGGAVGLACGLVRCGLGKLDVFDFDRVSEENISRQGHVFEAIGQLKIEALRSQLLRINPHVEVRCFDRDFTTLTESEIPEFLGDSDLIINATDSFKASAFGNRIALKLKIPALFIGMYQGGRAGEIIYWDVDITSCMRCLLAKRFAAHQRAQAEGRSLDPPSDGCTIFDVGHIDAIAGDLILGLLTRGADNRFGRLIDQLAGRNFIQVQLDPTWSLNGRNPIRERLQIPSECSAYFSWNAIALSDPDAGQLYCPDCEEYRGHQFIEFHGVPARHIPDEVAHNEWKILMKRRATHAG